MSFKGLFSSQVAETMIIVLGGAGYVGSALCGSLQQQQIPYRAIGRRDLDYTQESVLMSFLKETRPEFLINAAGYTGRPNVDACELHKAECLAGNAVLPGVIARACEALDVPWGHISSGCIFTGRRADGRGFTEDDAPNFSFRQNNCSFYSGCKALGEEILAGAKKCYVWRLRIPFNNQNSPRNYLSKLMNYSRLLDAENSLSHLQDFAAACISCWTGRVPFGIYNLTNPGHVTSREVVQMIQRHGLVQKEFQFFESEEQFMQLAAKTPRSNCVLDTTKQENLGLPMRPVHEALEQAMRSWDATPV